MARQTNAEYQRRYREKHPDRVRSARFKNRFGITAEQYDSMLAAQNGVCAVCRQKCETYRSLAVDHDHKSGAVRGLLCLNCNAGLGNFKDDPLLVRAAADYLERACR